MKEKIFTFLLIVLIIFPFGRTLWRERERYLSPFNLEQAQNLYNISQYTQGEGASWIPDEILFAYAGWYYLQGGSPILVNPENPPLGKYLIGLGIKFLNSEKILMPFFGFFSLGSFFLLSHWFFKKTWLALIPVAFFSWERLFQEQLIYVSQFELFALTFLNLAFLFFLKGEEKRKYFLLSSFFVGALWGTRPWMATIPLLFSWGIYLAFLKKKLKIAFSWLLSLPIAVFVLLLAYSKLFLEGWGPYKVLSVQKWILWYHQSRLINFGTIWPLIYLNRWYVWWGDQPFLPMVQWNIFWPIFTTLAIIFSCLVFLSLLKKRKKLRFLKIHSQIIVLCFYYVFYLAFLSIGNVSSRYLFYLLPYGYLLGIYLLANLDKKYFLKKLRKR